MDTSPVLDPIALGQRIVAILETGRRTATYKLATLSALIDHCVENLPADPAASIDVAIVDLADRVIEIYWRQVRPFEGRELRQSTQPNARILAEVERLRAVTGANAGGASLAVAKMRAPGEYERSRAEVEVTLVQQPLHRLQRLPGHDGTRGPSDTFLYDDSWMHDGVSQRVIALHGNAITLRPGVAAGLARLSGLLKPALEILWVDEVRRMNRYLEQDVPDIGGHLFGRERIPLAPARAALKDGFGGACFYCAARLAPNNPVDHVLPWTRVGIDGLTNLVLACGACNSSKSHALPAVEHVDRAVSRDRVLLEQIAESISWPTQHERVVSAARGLYLSAPAQSPTWLASNEYIALDLSQPPRWIIEGRVVVTSARGN